MFRLQVRNEADTPDIETYHVYMYSSIENDSAGFGFTAKALINELSDKTFNELILHVNSEGGDLFEAIAIYNYLDTVKLSGTTVKAIVDSLCASSASVITMAAQHIYMKHNARMMIHNPMAVGMGDSDKLKEYAQALEEITNECINIYANRTGLAPETIKDLMKKESWLNAETCKEFGFCDEILEPEKKPEPEPEPEEKGQSGPSVENKIKDSQAININTNFKPVNHEQLAIENMARIINSKRAH